MKQIRIQMIAVLATLLVAIGLIGCDSSDPNRTDSSSDALTVQSGGNSSTPDIQSGDSVQTGDSSNPAISGNSGSSKPVQSQSDKPADSTSPVSSSQNPQTTDKPQSSTPKPTEPPKPTDPPKTTQKPDTNKPNVGTSITVRYYVSDSSAGSLSGSTTQTIKYGQTATSAVTATAKLGYKFTGWSDGVKSATRSGESFEKNQNLTANFEIDALELPILYLTTKNGATITSKDVYIDGTISVRNAESQYLFENLAMQIRGRGNYTWSEEMRLKDQFPTTRGKVPYKIKLSEKKNLLGEGRGEAKVWTLLADHCDQALLRNYMALNFARNMKYISWNSAAQSVEVFLNGEYRGVFLLCEQNQVNKYRVNINDDVEAQPDQRGYLIELSGYASENRFDIWGNGYDGPPYEVKSDLSANRNLANQQIEYIRDYVQQCWNAVASGSQSRVENLMDINSVIDSYIVEELFKNLDAGWDSFYMYKDKGGKLCFGPLWDFDQTGGNADEGCENYYDLRGGYTNAWFKTLLRCSWFKEKLAACWNEVKADADKIPATIRAQAKAGYNSYCRNFDRWPIFGQKINRETEVIRNLRSYTAHYEYYADWMQKRIDWLDEYWNSPSFSFSGKLTLSGRGTSQSPYLVTSAADFQNFTACVLNGQDFSGKYFRQTADVDMSGVKGYNGMGSSCTFAGVYDGQGHTVNVVINGNDNSVFPYLTGKVYNVVITGKITNSGISAGLCRSVRQGGVIVNCVSLAEVTSTGGNAGGITASNQNGAVIANCFFGGSLNAASDCGPINVWYDDRNGDFMTNFYLEGLPYNCPEHSWMDTGESAVGKNASAANSAVSALNSGRSRAASAGSINSSSLCEWTVRDNRPALKTK